MLIVKIGQTVKTLFKKGFFYEIPPLFPYNEILKILMISFGFPCFAETISLLLVKIGRTVEKLFKREDFWKFPDCSPKKGLEKCLMILGFPLVELNPLVYCK
jgi:hypothetical protein